MRKEIDTAPKNGQFVILEDDASGSYAVARWSAEASQWLDDDGTPARLNATHWHLPQTAVSLVSEGELAPSRGMAAQQQGPAKQGQSGNTSSGSVPNARRRRRKILTAPAAAGAWIFRRRRSMFALAACFVAVAGISPMLNHADPDNWLLRRTAESADETNPTHALGQERERATRLASDTGTTGRESESQAALFRQAGEAANREKEADDQTIVQLRRSLQLELAKAEKLADQLAEAKRDSAVQTSLARKAMDEATRAEAEKERITGELRQALKREEDATAHANLRTIEQVALKQERDNVDKLRIELAAAHREGESRVMAMRSASDELTRLRESSARATDELRQVKDRTEKLAGELDEARRAAETNMRSADERDQALREAQGKAEKLRFELVSTRQELEAETAAARAARDEARRAAETNKRLADEQDEAQGKMEKLTAELTAARKEAEARAEAARVASEEARRARETNKRSANEQRQVLRDAQDKAEKLGAELAAALREVQSQVSAASLAKGQVAVLKEAAERSADEYRRALEQESAKAEKLAAELAETRSRLETYLKSKPAEEIARDNQLAATRGELQKAEAEGAAARESLEAERIRTQQAEQQLAAIRESTAGHSSPLESAASPTVYQPSIAPPLARGAPTKPLAAPEPDKAQAARLIARANLLLEQGNIGAARNMFDRAAEMGSTEALFWLAETYDPLLLSVRQTIGTQSDIARARELYDKALAGGVSKAKVRLEALEQRTEAR